MISIGWMLQNGFWTATVELDDSEIAEMVDGYVALPTLDGIGVSRVRNTAVSYALEDLALKLRRPDAKGAFEALAKSVTGAEHVHDFCQSYQVGNVTGAPDTIYCCACGEKST